MMKSLVIKNEADKTFFNLKEVLVKMLLFVMSLKFFVIWY